MIVRISCRKQQEGKTDGKRKKVSKSYMTTRLERLSYGAYFIGQNISFLLLYMYLVTFFTDVGIPAATVGTITLIVKIWDAINDPIFGGIVDKVKFKKGKFIPWLRMSLFAIPITTVLLFAIPTGISLTAKIIWAVVGYILWDTAYTMCDVPISGLVTTMTNKLPERMTLMSVGRVASTLAALIVSIVIPAARAALGGWLPTVIILSVLALLTMAPVCFIAKERVQPKQSQKDMKLKEMFVFLGKNKYLLIFFLAIIVYGAGNISSTYGMYTVRFLLGDERLMVITSMMVLLPTLILGALIPAFSRKIDKFYLLWGCMALFVLTSTVSYFVGYQSLNAYIIMLVLRSLPMAMIGLLMYMFTPDCVEYGLYKTGISAPGISFSVQTFMSKFTTALATAIGAFALAYIGFVEGEGATQPTGFNDSFWAISIFIPVVFTAIAAILLTQYKLRDKHVEVIVKCNNEEISREDAERQLGGKI